MGTSPVRRVRGASSARRIEVIGDATLYLGDCREIMPTIGKADAVVTDPPYGIGFNYESYDDSRDEWFILIDQVLPLCRAAARFVIMPCCGQDRIGWWYANHAPTWIICWHKGSPGHKSSIGFSDWEAHLCWGRPHRAMHDHFSTACGFDDNGHPCPKPIEYAMWLVQRASEKNGVVIDPFMGSGTTGVACLMLDRHFIGIEIDPKYFDIACKRIDKEYRSGKFMRSNRGMLKTKQTVLLPTAVARQRARRKTT